MTEYGTAQAASQGYGATLSAFFDDRDQAVEAIERLRANGVPEDRVRLTEGSAQSQTTAPREQGFFEALGDFFFPDEDRATYAEGLSRGGYLVTVQNLSPEMQETAIDVLEAAGAVDVDEREAEWRSEGWSGSTSMTGAASGMAAGATSGSQMAGSQIGGSAGFGETRGGFEGADMRDQETVQVVEERLKVGKRDAQAGRVRVRSYVVEEPVSEDVTLTEERVSIERRPVDRPLGAADDAFRERSIEAEERIEEAVVSKEARVVEEIGLRRETETHHETISDTVRHTEVEIEDDRDTTLTPDRDRR